MSSLEFGINETLTYELEKRLRLLANYWRVDAATDPRICNIRYNAWFAFIGPTLQKLKSLDTDNSHYNNHAAFFRDLKSDAYTPQLHDTTIEVDSADYQVAIKTLKDTAHSIADCVDSIYNPGKTYIEDYISRIDALRGKELFEFYDAILKPAHKRHHTPEMKAVMNHCLRKLQQDLKAPAVPVLTKTVAQVVPQHNEPAAQKSSIGPTAKRIGGWLSRTFNTVKSQAAALVAGVGVSLGFAIVAQINTPEPTPPMANVPQSVTPHAAKADHKALPASAAPITIDVAAATVEPQPKAARAVIPFKSAKAIPVAANNNDDFKTFNVLNFRPGLETLQKACAQVGGDGAGTVCGSITPNSP